MKHTLLIDADILVYKSLSSAEKEVEWEPGEWTITCNHEVARDTFNQHVASLLHSGDYARHILCFSDTSNFRKKLDPSYKSNRKNRKPLGYKVFRTSIMEEHSKVSVSKPNLEADDCIGILATNGNIASPVVWSEDKDLQQIPGLRWTPSGVVEVSEHDADLFFYTQVLTGDTADGYPGCTGIGPVKADALLSGVDITDVESVWSIIKGTYAKANIPEDFALTQAQLARILRSSDWDKTKQEPILWTPHRTRTV